VIYHLVDGGTVVDDQHLSCGHENLGWW
jgi:hypothetical protein